MSLHAVRSLALPPQGQEPLAPVAQLRRLVVVFATAVEPVGCNARVRVGLAEREEVDPGLEGANMVRRAVGDGGIGARCGSPRPATT